MPSIKLVSKFSPSDTNILGVKHNAHIPLITIRRVCRLIFALNYSRYRSVMPTSQGPIKCELIILKNLKATRKLWSKTCL